MENKAKGKAIELVEKFGDKAAKDKYSYTKDKAA